MIGIGINMGIGVGAGGVARAYPAGSFAAFQNWVRFTRASVQYLTRTFSAATIADTDAFTFSGWLNFKEGDTGAHVIFRLDPTSATSTFMVSRAATSGFLSVIANGAFGTSSDEQFLIADGPQHILVTGQRTGGAWVLEMYRNGVAVANTPSSNNDVTIALATATRCRIGAGATPANTNALGAEASDFFFSTEYTAPANVSRFYNSGWVDLGNDGTATGAAAPLVYFGGESRSNTDVDETAANGWSDGYNRGTLGAFTATNGPFANAPGYVRFLGSDHDYLTHAALDTQPASLTSFLVAARVILRPDYRMVFIRGSESGSGALNVNFSIFVPGVGDAWEPRVACSGFDSGTGLVQFGIGASVPNPTNGTALPYGVPLLIVCSGDGATGALKLSHYNYATRTWTTNSASIGTAPTSNMDLSADAWEIGDAASSYDLNGDVSLICLSMAADSAAYVDVTNSTVRANLLGPVANWGVGTPQVLLGEQTDGTYDSATQWNAGTNRGSAADAWTANGTVTNV